MAGIHTFSEERHTQSEEIVTTFYFPQFFQTLPEDYLFFFKFFPVAFVQHFTIHTQKKS